MATALLINEHTYITFFRSICDANVRKNRPVYGDTERLCMNTLLIRQKDI